MKYGSPAPLAVDTRMNPPPLLCQKCNARKNKVNERRREMEKAAREEERANSMTRDEFWNENRKKLKKVERDRLEQRTDEILFMYGVMDDYVNGTDGTTLGRNPLTGASIAKIRSRALIQTEHHPG